MKRRCRGSAGRVHLPKRQRSAVPRIEGRMIDYDVREFVLYYITFLEFMEQQCR